MTMPETLTLPEVRITAPEVARRAKEQLAELTGLKPDTVSSLNRDEAGWHAALEMVELRRVPDSGDVLATYEVSLDEAGNLTGYERTRRYQRGQMMG
ncbi:MAG: gas vesicle protein [Ardenticatenaceae bacterium]|nr:gas vesicle protein [Ardenticatenaceae bacterium]HBY99585.1 gas vesicle protein [Chloroflexota bacterium]